MDGSWNFMFVFISGTVLGKSSKFLGFWNFECKVGIRGFRFLELL